MSEPIRCLCCAAVAGTRWFHADHPYIVEGRQVDDYGASGVETPEGFICIDCVGRGKHNEHSEKHGRSPDPEVTEALVRIAEEEGL